MKQGSEGLHIRQAHRADLSLVQKLENIIFAQRDDLFSRAQLRYLLSSSNAGVFIFLHNQEPIGYGIALVNRLTNKELKGRIYSIGFLPEWRSAGMGKVFLGDLERWLLHRGVAFITAETRADSLGAKGFFEKMGYHVVEMLPSYYGQTDGYRMTKVIKEGYSPKRYRYMDRDRASR
jgi:[ribosomal protein S18]-alanine N-acetyltransferase